MTGIGVTLPGKIISDRTIFIAGSKIDCVQIPDVITAMESWIRSKVYHNYIVTSNAHNIVLGVSDLGVRSAVNESSFSVPDGFSLVLAARLYGCKLKKRVYGPDLMLEFLRVSEEKGYSNFFYGSTQETVAMLLRNLKEKFPRLKIAGSFSPPFSSSIQALEGEAKAINESCADVVWVGLGGVKQECWMHENKNRLNIPVMVGVGAAFDFFAGTKPQAPRWMGEFGLEWFFRLISEPRRLWRRYLVNNALFIWYVGSERLVKLFRSGI